MSKVLRAGLKGLKHDKITLEGKEYDLTELSEAQFQHYNNYRIVDAELLRLQRKFQIGQTARAYHAALLKDLIAPKNA